MLQASSVVMNDDAECQALLVDLVVHVLGRVHVLCLYPVPRIDLNWVELETGFDYVPLDSVVLAEEDQLETLLSDGACWVANRNEGDVT